MSTTPKFNPNGAARDSRQSSPLLPQDFRLFEMLRVPAAMYEPCTVRVNDWEARNIYAMKWSRSADLSGLVFIYFSPKTGKPQTCRLRLDTPVKDSKGKQVRYLSPSSDAPHLFFPPGAAEKLKNLKTTIVLVEAHKSALALMALFERLDWTDWIAVAMSGCWGWHTSRRSTVGPDGKERSPKGPLADLAYCDGHPVIISLDSNMATNPKVKRACRALTDELRRPQRRCSVRICDLPAMDDVNGPDDYLVKCGDQALIEVLNSARSPDVSPRQQSNAQDKADQNESPYTVNDQGVYCQTFDRDGEPKDNVWLCAPLEIAAKTRNAKSEDWGRLLRFRDSDHIEHAWAMPAELLQRDGGVHVRCELARLGLTISPNRNAHQMLLGYIGMWPVRQTVRCVDRLGWHGPVYVTPSGAIGDAGTETVVFQHTSAVEPALSTKGTTQQWRDQVAKLAHCNSRMMFPICVALAGPLLEIAKQDSGGFHQRGGSSIGKTTGQRLGASVYGEPEAYVREWRATVNGLEGLAALHNDGVLILDEIGQIDAHEVGAAAYLLANGRGKTRAAKEGTARHAAQWRLFFLSAGEESLSTLMNKVGRKPTAGQEIRLADFDADAGKGMGAIEVLNGYPNPGALIADLKDAAGRYYGSVGKSYLGQVVSNRAELTVRIPDGIRRFVRRYAGTGTTGQIERVAERFGLVAAAGELATFWGYTGWEKDDATKAVGECFRSWLESFGGPAAIREDRAMLAQVKGFLEAHGASRFETLVATDNRTVVINRAGFIRYVRKEGQEYPEYLILPEAFKSEVCKGVDHRSVIKALLKHHWLIPDGEGKSTQPARLPGTTKLTRVYVLGEKVWDKDE